MRFMILNVLKCYVLISIRKVYWKEDWEEIKKNDRYWTQLKCLISFDTQFDSAVSKMSQQPKMSMCVDPGEDFGNILNSQAEKDNRLIAAQVVPMVTWVAALRPCWWIDSVWRLCPTTVRKSCGWSSLQRSSFEGRMLSGRKMRSEEPKIFFHIVRYWYSDFHFCNISLEFACSFQTVVYICIYIVYPEYTCWMNMNKCVQQERKATVIESGMKPRKSLDFLR